MIEYSKKAEQTVMGFVKLNDIKIFSGKGIETNLNIYVSRLNGKEFDYLSLGRDLRSVLDSFVLSRKRIKKYESNKDYMELSLEVRNKFRNSYANRGELGELILYTFLEGHLRAPKILSKMSLKTSKNMYVNGADGIHFLKLKDNRYHLIYGESKMIADFTRGFTEACTSIKTFLDKNKRFELGLIDSQLENEILDEQDIELISEILYPTKHQNQVVVADAFSVFIGFNLNISNKWLSLSDEEYEIRVKERIKKKIEKSVSKIEEIITENDLLGKNFYIYIMPFTKLDETRKMVLEDIVK